MLNEFISILNRELIRPVPEGTAFIPLFGNRFRVRPSARHSIIVVSNFFQCLIEVCNEIIDIFNSYAKPDERVH